VSVNLALASLTIPFATALLLLLLHVRRAAGFVVVGTSLLSLVAAALSLQEVVASGSQTIAIGDWPQALAIHLRITALVALLLAFTALVHLIVALYAVRTRHKLPAGYWPLSSLLHGSLAALWLSADLFNLYVTLELLSFAAVALVILAGPKAYDAALRYLLLSLAASLCYLLGVALMYSRYGLLDTLLLQQYVEADQTTHLALLLMTVGLMVKAALWPLHLWLPPAHANAPTAVSALLSALVVKAPLFILWTLWSQVAPASLAIEMGPLFACAGILALVSGGWSALRAPHLKTVVAYSTVAQLGYALLPLGLLLYWQQPQMHVALWFFVLAHGLAKVSMFLAAGEMQHALGSKRVSSLCGATQTVPVAMFAFAVAGGSLIGLPPSGGFLAKWVLLEPMFTEPEHWPWAVGVLLGTVVSAAYVFRVVALGFYQAKISRQALHRDRVAEWLALLPALLVWGMALVGERLITWLGGVTR
jgi:multicomponent Na+:H+ antiporter subunit D